MIFLDAKEEVYITCIHVIVDEMKMFSTSLRKKLIEQFSIPARHHEFHQLAELAMEDTRYTSVQNFLRALEDEKIVRMYNLKAKNGKTVSLYCS